MLINIRNKSVLQMKKCILREHSINFNIVQKGEYLKYTENTCISKSLRTLGIIHRCFLLGSVHGVHIVRVNTGWLNTVVKLYFYFVLNDSPQTQLYFGYVKVAMLCR